MDLAGKKPQQSSKQSKQEHHWRNSRTKIQKWYHIKQRKHGWQGHGRSPITLLPGISLGNMARLNVCATSKEPCLEGLHVEVCPSANSEGTCSVVCDAHIPWRCFYLLSLPSFLQLAIDLRPLDNSDGSCVSSQVNTSVAPSTTKLKISLSPP
jgi:hypothetical protein